MGAVCKLGKSINEACIKLIFLTKRTFVQRFEGVALEQIFWNFKLQYKTQQIFQPLALNNFLAFTFLAQAVFKPLKKPTLGFENLYFSIFLFILYYKFRKYLYWSNTSFLYLPCEMRWEQLQICSGFFDSPCGSQPRSFKPTLKQLNLEGFYILITSYDYSNYVPVCSK